MDTLKLTNETIDILSEKITAMYENSGVDRKNSLRARLLLEETLIKYQRRYGEDIELTYKEYRIFAQTRFTIRIKAASFDPFTLEENPMAFMLESVMASLENNIPTWKYHNLENEITFTVHKKTKINSLIKIGIALASAVALGIPLRLWLPYDSLSAFVTNYLEPLANAYAGLFCVMAVLLTFFAITLGIVRIGDMQVAGITSRKLFTKFYIMSALLVSIISLPTLPLFENISIENIFSNTVQTVSAKTVYDVLIDFIPSNVVSPFLNFNTMHIIIIGAMFGFSLLVMGQKGENTVKLFDECNQISIITNNFLNKFIYHFVALKVFSLITVSDFSMLKSTGKLIAMIILGDVLIFAFYTVYVCFRCKISIKEYFKKMISPLVVCLSSANFGAAFSCIVDSLLSLDSFDGVCAIALNLGSVIFRPACTLTFLLSAVTFAEYYGVSISLVWVIIAFILSLLLSAAVPNIPGVSVAVITILFTQLGLPSEAISMMIAINAPLQFLTVTVDTWCLSAECVICGKKKNKKSA